MPIIEKRSTYAAYADRTVQYVKEVLQMTDEQVVESMDNAWRALAKIYGNSPDNGIRIARNLTARIIGEVKSEVKNFTQKRKSLTERGKSQ